MTLYLDPILAHGVGSGNPLADQSTLSKEVFTCFAQGEEILILVGKSGTGKSTLLRSFPADTAAGALRMLHPRAFQETGDAGKFVSSLAYEFGLRRGDTLAKLGMSLPGEASRPAPAADPQGWSEHDVFELIGELVGTDRESAMSVLRVDHCERIAFAGTDEVNALRGACRAASAKFRVILVVRQDALGPLLDALDGCFARSPRLVFVHGLTPDAAAAFAGNILVGTGITGVSEEEIRRLIEALERGGYIWPVALNAVLEELSLEPASAHLLNVSKFSARDINKLLARSVERRLSSAPAGLGDECYWTLRAIARGEQIKRATTEQSLIAASTTRNPAELSAVLDHLMAVRLIVRDAKGGWHFAHEAIFDALQQLRDANARLDDAQLFDVIERWQISGRLAVADANILAKALRVAPTLPLAALVLLSLALATGLVSDLPGTLELLARRLKETTCRNIQDVVRGLQIGLHGRAAPMLHAALLYAGTGEGIGSFLQRMSSTSTTDHELMISSNLERLLMSVPAAPLAEAIGAGCGLADAPLVAVATMRAILRREDVVPSLESVVTLVDTVRGIDPGLALECVARFDPAALGLHCLHSLQSERAIDRVAALVKLSDAPDQIVRACEGAVIPLLASSDAMVRRRALGLVAAKPDVFAQQLLPLLSAEPSPLVREGVLEVIRPEHPEAGRIIAASIADSFDFVRESAVYAASRCALPIETLRPLLMEAVTDTSEKVREAAIRICQRFDVQVPLDEILMGLRSHNEALLGAFMKALGAETTDSIDLALADLAMDGDLRQDIRVAALARLGERGGEIAVWVVASLLADPDPEILATAIACAQMSADAQHLDQLQRLSRHPLAVIRERVVYAVGEIGGDAAVELCLNLLFDPVAEIRARAVYILIRLGAATHLPAIEMTLAHEDSDIVLAAMTEARAGLS